MTQHFEINWTAVSVLFGLFVQTAVLGTVLGAMHQRLKQVSIEVPRIWGRVDDHDRRITVVETQCIERHDQKGSKR